MMARMKKLLSVLLCVALCVSVLALSVSAEGSETYSVSLPDGWSELGNAASASADADYIVTLPDELANAEGLLLVWAEFTDTSLGICALTGTHGDGSEFAANKRKLPEACITGNFEVKYELISTDDLTPSAILTNSGPDADGSEEHPYKITSELELLKLMAAGSLVYDENRFYNADMHYTLETDITFHTPIAMEIGYLDGEFNWGVDAGKIAVSMLGFGYKIRDAVTIVQNGTSANNPFFHGTFDGKEHSISGLHTIPDEDHFLPSSQVDDTYPTPINAVALFGVCDGTIKNLTVETAGEGIAKNRPCAAILVAITKLSSAATIENCTVIGKVSNGWTPANNGNSNKVTKSYTALLAANGTANITGCKAYGSVTYTPSAQPSQALKNVYVAGLAANPGATMNCENRANVTVDLSSQTNGAGTVYVAGVIASSTSESKYCANFGTVTFTGASSGTSHVGGFGGSIKTVTGCHSEGAVIANGATNCGAVTGNIASGGAYKAVFGYANQAFYGKTATNATFSYCYKLGDATGGEDETTTVKTLSREDFDGTGTYDLVKALNDALGDESEMIFALVGDNAEYPTFIERPASQVIDLVETHAVNVQAPETIAANIVVNGQVQNGVATVSVDYTKACVVLYTADNGASYHRMTLQRGEAHNFTVDYQEGMQFVVAVKGDVSGDGIIDAEDFGPLVVAFLNTGTGLTPLQNCLGDLNGDGIIDAEDFGPLVVDFLGTALTW